MKRSTHFRIQAAAAGMLALGGGFTAGLLAAFAVRVHAFGLDVASLVYVFAVGILGKASVESFALAISFWREAAREGQ
jgi:hypothetical protein